MTFAAIEPILGLHQAIQNREEAQTRWLDAPDGL